MTVHISDSLVKEIFTPEHANHSMFECFRMIAEGTASTFPRLQLDSASGWLRIQAGVLPEKGYMGFKAYSVAKGFGARYAVFLYRIETGELISVLDADTLTVMRTGAHSAVATSLLANKDAKSLGVIGSSLQAKSMIECISAISEIRTVRIYSPNKNHREKLETEMRELGFAVQPSNDARAVVENSEIVGVATGNKTQTPIVSSDWFKQGTHINAVGAVGLGRVELDTQIFRRAAVVAADSLDECLTSSQEMINAINSGDLTKDRIVDLSELVAGRAKGRTSKTDITLFKSQGSGVQDVVSAATVYEECVRKNLGKDIGEIGPALRKRT